MLRVQNLSEFADLFAQLRKSLERLLLRDAARVVGINFRKLDFATRAHRDN